MVYKSKKYRRKYSKRLTKRMYGGTDTGIDTGKINGNTQPTLISNIHDASKLGLSLLTNATADAIQQTAEASGLNPNESISDNVGKINDKLEEVVDVLNSPEGEKLKAQTGELLEDTIDTVKPGIKKMLNIGNDLIKEEIPIAGNMLNELILATPGVGQLVAAVEEVGNVTQATEKAAASVAELTQVGSDTLQDLNDKTQQAQSLWTRTKNLFSNASNNINSGISQTIKTAQNEVDKYGNHIMTGGSLKQYQKEKNIIGGRIHKSQTEFLEPFKIKTKTKRRKIKHKLFTQKH